MTSAGPIDGEQGALDALLNEGNRLSAYAADDAHFRVDDAFGGWVMVRAEANEQRRVSGMIAQGRSQVGQRARSDPA